MNLSMHNDNYANILKEILILDCPPLQPGEGALASSRDTAFGTVVTFSCPLGQEFATGKSRISTECLPGGNWSVTYIPKCQEVYCDPVPQIDNGFSIGSSNVTYRGLATYQCYAGFAFPSGRPTEKISCLADGRWEKKPSCLGLLKVSQSIYDTRYDNVDRFLFKIKISPFIMFYSIFRYFDLNQNNWSGRIIDPCYS